MTNAMKKYLLALILNIIPFFLTCFLYGSGLAILVMILTFQYLINMVNYKWTKKILPFAILNSVMLISAINSIEISTQLYYSNISSDPDTLTLGNFEILVSVIFVVAMTLIGIVRRIASKKSDQ